MKRATAEAAAQRPLPGPPNDTAPAEEQLQLDAYIQQLNAHARDTGMEAARSADPDWSSDVLAWIWNLPQGYEFDADTIRQVFGRSNASGAVIRTARKRGYIEQAGVSRSKSVTRHAGLQLQWVRT